MSGEAGGGYFYPDSEDEALQLRLVRHADHDPTLMCRPALGYGLCEVLGDEERSEVPGGRCPVCNEAALVMRCGECGTWCCRSCLVCTSCEPPAAPKTVPTEGSA